MGRIQFNHAYHHIISLENLLGAWQEFIVGKKYRPDVQKFELQLMTNLFSLHHDLTTSQYRHSDYEAFNISDPKPRHIHKARVRDRLLHHAIYRQLYPFFDRIFIADSYSCRLNKGTHKALHRFQTMARKVSRNSTRTCWILQCDIKQFFASIDHAILLYIVRKYISNARIITLLRGVIESFSLLPGKGLPLGNLTSQLFVNIYMNEFDQFVKHRLKVTWYIRYADDFVLLSEDRNMLSGFIPKIRDFLSQKLCLTLHPRKITIKTLASGIDFLGWVNFSMHRVLRTSTKRGMMRKLRSHSTNETVQSYLGLLTHGNAHRMRQQILNQYK